MTTPYHDTPQLLSRLIQNACVNDGTPDSGQEVRNVETLERYFDGSGVVVERVEPHPGRVSAIFRVKGSDPNAESLTLLGHTDVVPVTRSSWSRDPFSGEIADGVVWGRGAIDMLNLTSAMAVVTRAIALRPEPLRGDLVFAAVADEEAGSRFGAGWISENRPDLLPWQNAITESGGAHIPTNGEPTVTITVGEKGGVRRRLRAHGRSGHGSMPWGSDNAAVTIAEAVVRIARYRSPARLDDQWRAFVDAHGFDDALRTALLDTATIDDSLHAFGTAARFAHAISHLTVTPTVLQSGDKGNVIPSEGTLDLDIRLLPGHTESDVDALLVGALGDLGEKVTIEKGGIGHSSGSGTDTALFGSLTRAVDSEFAGATIVPVKTGGGTDARWVRQRGGNAYGFALFERDWTIGRYRSLFHGDDEHVDINSLLRTTRALDFAVTDFLSSPHSTQKETIV